MARTGGCSPNYGGTTHLRCDPSNVCGMWIGSVWGHFGGPSPESLIGGGGGRKRHTMPHPAQPQHTNYWAPRTRKRHQREHRPQRPTESSDPTQHAKGRTGDRPGPRKGATTRRNVTQGGGCWQIGFEPPPPPRSCSGSWALWARCDGRAVLYWGGDGGVGVELPPAR